MPHFLNKITFLNSDGNAITIDADNTKISSVSNDSSTVPLRDENYHFQVGNVSSSYEDGLVVVNKNYVDGQINILSSSMDSKINTLSSSVDNKINTLSSSVDNKINTLSGVTVKTSNIDQTISGIKTFSNLRCSRAPSSSFDVIRKGDIDGLYYVDNDSSQDFSFQCGELPVFCVSSNEVEAPGFFSIEHAPQYDVYNITGSIKFGWYQGETYVLLTAKYLDSSGDPSDILLSGLDSVLSPPGNWVVKSNDAKFFYNITSNDLKFVSPNKVTTYIQNPDCELKIIFTGAASITSGAYAIFEKLIIKGNIPSDSTITFAYMQPAGQSGTMEMLTSEWCKMNNTPSNFINVSNIGPKDAIIPVF